MLCKVSDLENIIEEQDFSFSKSYIASGTLQNNQQLQVYVKITQTGYQYSQNINLNYGDNQSVTLLTLSGTSATGEARSNIITDTWNWSLQSTMGNSSRPKGNCYYKIWENSEKVIKKLKIFTVNNIWEKATVYLFWILPNWEWRDGN